VSFVVISSATKKPAIGTATESADAFVVCFEAADVVRGVEHVPLTDVAVFTADLKVAAALAVAHHGFGPAVVPFALGFQVPPVDAQVPEQNVAIFTRTHELVVRTTQTLDAVHVWLVPAECVDQLGGHAQVEVFNGGVRTAAHEHFGILSKSL